MESEFPPSPCTESQCNGDLETCHLSPGTTNTKPNSKSGFEVGGLQDKELHPTAWVSTEWSLLVPNTIAVQDSAPPFVFLTLGSADFSIMQ